jgi:NADPH:quinone reductase-like Zn-dependent oxidoreductase
MKALIIKSPGEASIEDAPEPQLNSGRLLLRVRMVGLCGSDLNSYRGRNPMVQFPRIPGHEIAATIIDGNVSAPELCGRNGRYDVSLHKLRQVSLLPARSTQRVRVQ